MIRLSDNLEINKPAPVDDRLGVFVSTASALSTIAEDRRYVGLTVIVDDGSGAVEYWFKDGVTDSDLEAKSTGGGGGGVPYTGATQNVDLGTYNLTADQLALNVNPTGALSVGMTEWNDSLGSSQTLLKGGSVTLKNGVDLVARVVNKVNPNTTLTKAEYQVVKVTGAQGQRLAVNLAQANSDLNSADTLGVVTETIAPNQEGFILTVGQLQNINTTGSLQGETWNDGDVLYLSPTTAGRMTKVKPNGSTGHIVVLGYVEYSHANNGKIYVKIMNGWELDELHNVYINPATLADNDALIYESSTDLWKNKQVTKSMVGLGNVPNTDATNPANINQTSSFRFVTDTEKSTWNGKQDFINAGTTSQFYRGDKTFQPIGVSDVPKVVRPTVRLLTPVLSGSSTLEQVLTTITIPANTLVVNDIIKFGAVWSFSINAGTKIPRVRLGNNTITGNQLYSPTSIPASVNSVQMETLAIVTSSTNLRLFPSATASGYGSGTLAVTNNTINLSNAIDFTITIQKATAGDTASFEFAYIEILTS
jgi:nitrogen fixation protein